jgi:hypothetical protein
VSIRFKTFVSLFAFSVVPVLLLAALWLYTDPAKIKEHYENDFEILAEAAVSSFRNTIDLRARTWRCLSLTGIRSGIC